MLPAWTHWVITWVFGFRFAIRLSVAVRWNLKWWIWLNLPEWGCLLKSLKLAMMQQKTRVHQDNRIKFKGNFYMWLTNEWALLNLFLLCTTTCVGILLLSNCIKAMSLGRWCVALVQVVKLLITGTKLIELSTFRISWL